MASSTRGGKRGKKSKALKTYKTASGAQQYGSPEAFSKLGSKLMTSALKDKDPEGRREKLKAYYSADAGWESAMANKFPDSDNDYAEGEKIALERRKKYTNKKYGGKVTKMEGGGEVCRGMGRAYQGKPKKVQVR